MGEYNHVKSIQLICCNDDSWYHKNCLKKMAFSLNDEFDCPSCDNKNEFRQNMLSNGIFIPDSSYLPTINNSNDMDDDENEFLQKAKRKRVHKNWILEKIFSSKAEADNFLSTEKCWSYYYQNKSSAGLRINYRCNMMKFRGKQCDAAVYLLYNSENVSVQFHRSDSPHTHDDDGFKENAIDTIHGEMETEIRSLFQYNMKPKLILYNLSQKGFQPPSKLKLSAFLTKLRREKFGYDKLNFGTLEKWLNENNNRPLQENQPFVVEYELNIDENNNNNSTFRFFVSTKCLLKTAVNSEKLHADATYKLIWQGFPVLIIGTSDWHRKFHPIGICVSSNERTIDFEFMFRTLKNIVNELFDADFKPKVLISDAAKSIHNGFKNVFGDFDNIIMCWAHLRRQLVKTLSRFIRNRKQQSEFLGKLIQFLHE